MATSPFPPPPSNPSPPTDPLHGLPPASLLAAGLATEPSGLAALDRAVGPPPPTPEALAPEFPALELFELLGRGGMGAVYRARQRDLDRIVALKILRPGLDADPGFAERFTREARALAGLNHSGIVTLYEFGRTASGRYFILMEFVDGVNLRQLLAAGRLAPREALAIVPPLCDALQYAHDRGLVHRDIKPENILLDRLGRVKIADFGIARLAPFSGRGGEANRAFDVAGLTLAGELVGTPPYMAPEQRNPSAAVDHRADLYALGVVFYQMLTGETPGPGPLTSPSRRVQLDVRLDEIVLRALETDPARRYAAASEFKTKVETVVSDPPPSPANIEAKAPTGLPGVTQDALGKRSAGLPLLPASVLAFFIACFCGILVFSANELPLRVAVHFDRAGLPNSWAERGVALLIMLLGGVGVPTFLVGLFAVLRFLPTHLINLPHRDFWFGPTRIAASQAYLLRAGIWLAGLVALFFCCLQLLSLAAHQVSPPRLPTAGLWTLAGLHLFGTLLWGLRLVRHFSHPKRASGAAPPAARLAPALRWLRPWLLICLVGAGILVPVGTALAILRAHQTTSYPVESSAPEAAATDGAITSAQTWLEGIDRGDYEGSWQVAGQVFKRAITAPRWADALRAVRAPLGSLQFRESQGSTASPSLPGLPDGEYITLRFRTDFFAKAGATETLTLQKEADGQWRVIGYFIR